MTAFDPARFFQFAAGGHSGHLGIAFRSQGPGSQGKSWVELDLPYDPRLAGDGTRGVLAAGPIVTLMDMATSLSVWVRRGRFAHQATLDLRVDMLAAATPGRSVTGRGECYAIAGAVAFVRGVAYHAAGEDPIAHVAGTFMLLDAGK